MLLCFAYTLPVSCRRLWAGCQRRILRQTFRHLAVLLLDVIEDKMLSSSFMILRYHKCATICKTLWIWLTREHRVYDLHYGDVVLGPVYSKIYALIMQETYEEY